MDNMIYSVRLGIMVIKEFYVKLKNGGRRLYRWDDKVCLYYSVDTDKQYYMDLTTWCNLLYSI